MRRVHELSDSTMYIPWTMLNVPFVLYGILLKHWNLWKWFIIIIIFLQGNIQLKTLLLFKSWIESSGLPRAIVILKEKEDNFDILIKHNLTLGM